MHRIVGSGEPVVFVHGNASTHATWSSVIEPMSGSYCCISYDLRGHGASDLPFDEPSIDVLVADLERLRAELALDRMRVVGHSLGALIAAAYGLKHRRRVRAQALLAAPAGRTEADKEAGAKLIESLKRDGVARVMASLQHGWYNADFIAAHPDALEERLAQIRATPEDVFIRTYELYNRTEIATWLEKIAAPTLVMTGEHARLCGADVARMIADRLPNASLVVLKGMRNGILTEIPGRVAEELLRFFREH
jgi:pimeloyl-ACP methyl ester carboxylesterase